jgi:1-acyl-sn-glycerol-3-phosphate acyltransferase
MIYLRSSIFFITQTLTAVFFSILALFTIPFDFQTRFAVTSRWARFNMWSLKMICGLDYRVSGTENIPGQASIIMCKHQSAWETIALQEVFPPQTWVLKRMLLLLPFFGWGLWTLKPIAIDRSAGKRAIKQVIDQGRERLRDNIWVVIFPEGTRIPPGMKGRYKAGGAVLAVESGRPVIPVAHNAGEFWPRNSFLKKPGTIQIVIGPAIDPAGKTAEEILEATEQWIESTMSDISKDDYSGKLFRRKI